MITKKLTLEQRIELLKTLFDFDLININVSGSENDEDFVLYDEEGNIFYSNPENCQFDFSTLAGFFSYTAHLAKNQGYSECQRAMRKILGV